MHFVPQKLTQEQKQIVDLTSMNSVAAFVIPKGVVRKRVAQKVIAPHIKINKK